MLSDPQPMCMTYGNSYTATPIMTFTEQKLHHTAADAIVVQACCQQQETASHHWLGCLKACCNMNEYARQLFYSRLRACFKSDQLSHLKYVCAQSCAEPMQYQPIKFLTVFPAG